MGYFFKGTSLSILPIQLSSIRLRTCGWRRVEKGGEEGGAGERERERERERRPKRRWSQTASTQQRPLKRRWSQTASTQQRPLLSILILCPTTAAGIQFCLLCCQPEPMPRSLTARAPLSTQRRPCRPAAWLGKTIHMVSRAYRFPLPSITPHESYRQCPSEKQLFPARNVLS